MCSVILDLKMIDKINVSSSGKSATVACSFSGWLDERKSISLEVLFTRRVTGGKALTEFIKELTAALAGKLIIRVGGELRYLRYQDRDTGKEVERYQVIADSLYPSHEKKPYYSNLFMEGFVRPLSNAPIVKGDGQKCKASFWLTASGEEGNDRVGYLNLLVDGYDGMATQIEHMKLRDKSYVLVAGKLFATSFEGVLGIHLYDVNYAALSAKQKKGDEQK